MNLVKVVGIDSETGARILLASLLLVLPLPAMAVLGDNAASVLTDQARMKGTLRSVDAHTYVMHEITAPAGTVVREFVSPEAPYSESLGRANFRLICSSFLVRTISRRSKPSRKHPRRSNRVDGVLRSRLRRRVW